MWVAQITEQATQGEQEDQLAALQRRFPGYQFSIMLVKEPFIIGKPHPVTIQHEDDEATEAEILRHIVTELLNELITGHIGVEMES